MAMKYYRRMQYEIETGEEEFIVMFDSDVEGRQLEGYSDNVFAKIADFTDANGNARNKYAW